MKRVEQSILFFVSIGFVHSVANAPHVTSPCSLLGIANATKDVNMWSTSDKDYILNTLDQVHIYSVFLNVPETEINNCICLRNYKISNPLRYDPNPSVSFNGMVIS